MTRLYAERRLRVVLVTSHDSVGGASRAMHRIYEGLRCFGTRADTRLRVIHKTRVDDGILGGKSQRSWWEFLGYFLRTRFRKYFPRKPFFSDNKLLHSQALYPSGLGRELNAMRPDVIMLGWLGSAVMSILRNRSPDRTSCLAPFGYVDVLWRRALYVAFPLHERILQELAPSIRERPGY